MKLSVRTLALSLNSAGRALKFECEDLRDQVVSTLHQSIFSDPDLRLKGKLRAELERLELLGAKRKGKIPHLINDVTAGWGASLDSNF